MTSSLLRPKNVTKLTSQDFSILGPSQSKFLAKPVELKVRFLLFSQKRQYVSAPNLFQGLGENTCSIQPALKSNAPGL